MKATLPVLGPSWFGFRFAGVRLFIDREKRVSYEAHVWHSPLRVREIWPD